MRKRLVRVNKLARKGRYFIKFEDRFKPEKDFWGKQVGNFGVDNKENIKIIT